MGTRETDQPPLWIATSDLPTSPGHPFYARLTTLLDGHHFDRFVEGLCDLWVANYYSARNPLRLSSLVILGVVARMFRCATRSSCWCT